MYIKIYKLYYFRRQPPMLQILQMLCYRFFSIFRNTQNSLAAASQPVPRKLIEHACSK